MVCERGDSKPDELLDGKPDDEERTEDDELRG